MGAAPIRLFVVVTLQCQRGMAQRESLRLLSMAVIRPIGMIVRRYTYTMTAYGA